MTAPESKIDYVRKSDNQRESFLDSLRRKLEKVLELESGHCKDFGFDDISLAAGLINEAFELKHKEFLNPSIPDVIKEISSGIGFTITMFKTEYGIEFDEYLKVVADLNLQNVYEDIDADTPIYFWKKGLHAARFGEEEKAISAYTSAINLHPIFYQAYVDRGTAYWSLENYSKAMEDLSKAIEIEPNNKNAYLKRGYMLFSQRNCEKALHDFDQVSKLDPKDTENFLHMGFCYLQSNELERAIRNFSITISLDDQNEKAYRFRGAAFSGLEEYERAIDDFTSVIRLSPESLYGYYNRGTAWDRLDEDECAINDYTKIIELRKLVEDSGDEEYFVMLAESYKLRSKAFYRQGLIGRSKEDSLEAVRIFPDDESYQMLYKVFDIEMAKCKGNLTPEGKIINPEYQEALAEALTALDGEDFETARGLLQQALRHRNTCLAYTKYATTFFHKGMYREATGASENALELDPNDLQALMVKGVSYLHLGMDEENRMDGQFSLMHYSYAISAFEEALKQDPEHQGAKDLKEAAEHKQRVLGQKKNDPYFGF